jgi:hypothetical protein
MPLRDHFRPPVWARFSWEGFHGMWPATMVQRLVRVLPENFTAEPRTHLGAYYEIDVCAYEEAAPANSSPFQRHSGGSSATLAPPKPTFTAEVDLAEQYEYEVLVYDQSRGKVLVAAVEIVSPANKDRPENRQVFANKCVGLLKRGVCVSIVDLVTTRQFNLYRETLAQIDRSDPQFTEDPLPIYAATCRFLRAGEKTEFQSWAYPLVIGSALPELPIWLSNELNVFLDLYGSYEDACNVLRIH